MAVMDPAGHFFRGPGDTHDFVVMNHYSKWYPAIDKPRCLNESWIDIKNQAMPQIGVNAAWDFKGLFPTVVMQALLRCSRS